MEAGRDRDRLDVVEAILCRGSERKGAKEEELDQRLEAKLVNPALLLSSRAAWSRILNPFMLQFPEL